MTSALFIVSEDGYWGGECIEPFTTLTGAGVNITAATPMGGVPVVDECSADPEGVGEELMGRVVRVRENDERLQSPKPIAQVNTDEYDAVVFLGGCGTAWDVNQDRHARQVLLQMVADDDLKALVAYHAVSIPGFTRETDGSLFVEEREVTGFPNEQEEDIVDDDDLMPDGRKLPYRIEDEVKTVGGAWGAGPGSDTSVTVSGDPITARGPGSLAVAAQTLLDEL